MWFWLQSRPLVLWLVLFLVGMTAQMLVRWHLWFIPVAFLGLLILVKIGGKKAVYPILLMGCGMLRMWTTTGTPSNDILNWSELNGSTTFAELVVLDTTRTARGYPKLEVNVHRLAEQPVTGNALLYGWRGTIPGVGDTLLGRFVFRLPSQARNPYEFDYRAYLLQQGVGWTLRPVDGCPPITKVCQGRGVPATLQHLRNGIMRTFREQLSPTAHGVLTALLLGEKRYLERDIRDDFALTGTIHVLAVSGLHVGYVTMILLLIAGMVPGPRGLRTVITIAGLAGYCVLTGGAPSVIRASTMAALYLLGQGLERRGDFYNIFAGTALLMLLVDPWQVREIGFQLSFAAVFAIVTFFPRVRKLLPVFSNRGIVGKLVDRILDLLLVSLVAQLGTLALTVYHFQRIPLTGSLINLIVVPLVGLIVALGFCLLLLGSWIPFVGSAWGALLSLIIEGMVRVVAWAGSWPLAFVETRAWTILECILLFGSLTWLLLSGKRQVVAALTVLGLMWLNVICWRPLLNPASVSISVLDVGQGDAIHLQTHDGRHILVDTGPALRGRDAGRDIILPYLTRLGCHAIDLLILTHGHNDHIGGAEHLMRNMEVKRIWIPSRSYTSRGYRRCLALADSFGIPVDSVRAGHLERSQAPCILRVLAPPEQWQAKAPHGVNNQSIVVQALCGTNCLLLTGDAEIDSETAQLPYGDLLRSDWLKVGHHGSLTSSSSSYVDQVGPSIAIISVGERNTFGHPAEATLGTYTSRGIDLLRTDQEGALLFRINKDGLERVDWRNPAFRLY